MKDQKLGVCFSTYPGFAKGKRLKLQVKKGLLKYQIGIRGEKISATQACHKRGLGAEPPGAGGYRSLGAKHPAAGRFFVFWKKMANKCHLDHISHVFRAM